MRHLLLTFPLLSSFASIDAFLTPKATLDSILTPSSRRSILANPASTAVDLQLPHHSRRRHYWPSLYAEASDNGGDKSSEGMPEEGAENEVQEEEAKSVPEAELPSEDDSDILNSPAFLKRKTEVLQSDLVALDKELEEANAIYLKGKEEWGPKFDDLNKEVSVIDFSRCLGLF